MGWCSRGRWVLLICAILVVFNVYLGASSFYDSCQKNNTQYFPISQIYLPKSQLPVDEPVSSTPCATMSIQLPSFDSPLMAALPGELLSVHDHDHRQHEQERYLAISPYGGFNNQLDHLYYQIGWARALDRIMVLPLVSGSTHTADQGNYDLDLYLDTVHLSRIVRVISWDDFLHSCGDNLDAVVAMDGVQGDKFAALRFLAQVGLNYTESVFLPAGYSTSSADLRAMFAAAGLTDTRCVLLRGMGSFGDYDKAHFNEDTSLFIKVRQAVRLAPYLRFEASQWVRDHIGDRPFLAVHFRRGDYFTYCQSTNIPVYNYNHQATQLSGSSQRRIHSTEVRKGCYPPVEEAAAVIVQVAEGCKVRDVVLSTNAKEDELETLSRLLGGNKAPPNKPGKKGRTKAEDEVGLTVHRYEKRSGLAPNADTLVDMSISIQATCFLGNKYSSLTFTVLTQRRTEEAGKKGWDTAFTF